MTLNNYKTIFIGDKNAIVCAFDNTYLIVPKDKVGDINYLEEAWSNEGIRVNVSQLIYNMCACGNLNIDKVKA